MEDKEILENLGKIEIREGRERTIKSYVLRNNVLEEKEKENVIKLHCLTRQVHYNLIQQEQ